MTNSYTGMKLNLLTFSLILLFSPALFCSTAQRYKAVGDNNYPPLLFRNENGQPDGFDCEVIRWIEKESALKFDISLTSWGAAKEQVKNGEADILLGMNKTPERETYYDFTDPYLTIYTVIFVAKDNFRIKTIEDLSGKRVSVQKDDLSEEYLSRHYPLLQLVREDSQLDAINDLKYGRAEAAICNYYVGLYWLHKFSLMEGIKVIGKPVLTTQYSLAVRKGNYSLRSKLNSSIRSLQHSGEIQALKRKWFGDDYFLNLWFDKNQIVRLVAYLGIFGLAVMITGWVFVYLLRKRVSRATSKLKEINRYYKSLIENASDIIVVIKSNGEMTYVSPSLCKVLSYTPEELNDKAIYDIIYPGDIPIASSYFSGVRVQEKKLTEIKFVSKDGCRKILEILVNNLSEDQAIQGLIINARDITERVEAEKEIMMLAQTIRNIGECVNITDMKNNILFVNEAFLRTYGYEKEEVLGKKISILENSGEIEQLQRTIYYETLRKGSWQGELVNKRKNGEEFPVFLSTSLVYDKELPIALVGVALDITERRIAENQLIDARDRAERSDRLKSEFLAQVSHEIRTPVNTILSFTSLLRDELEGRVSEDLKQSFNIIDNGGRRLIRTIDMILNMSEIQAGNIEINLRNIDVAKDVLEPLIMEFSGSARSSQLDLVMENNAAITTLMCDSYTTSQIFQNLIDNAIKYTRQGYVKVVLYNTPANQLCVEVCDTGIGIAEEYLPRLFEPFTQEESGYTRRFEGNGLGLSLVKKYIALNNAAIEVESEKGKGTTFRVIFNII